ncbi:IclR family transcriptional regulator [Emcibacter sp.]|uniref:IclR family transcriptional regulator n=1 Tax=Emcibacter sp. TaxID=1979954 RepID=UPI002AA7624A|nr:helix-turn-helix domain-containing protein [Emcibacter sp.]
MLNQKVKTVRALERGLDVLMEVQSNSGTTLHELHQRLNLPKPTLLRMLVTLSKSGLVWQRIADGTYHPSAITLARRDHDLTAQIAEIASPHMEGLSRQVNLPSALAVPRFDHMMIVETNSPLVRLDSATLGPVGLKLSYIHTATGRAYLALCDADERDAIIDRIRPATATDDEEKSLRQILDDVCRRGYSLRDPAHCWFDRNKQTVLRDGRRSMAVAVRMHGKPVASLNITCPSSHDQLDEVVVPHFDVIRQTADHIGRALEDIHR